MQSINIIGFGRVGKTLAALIAPLENHSLQAIYSPRADTNAPMMVDSIAQLPSADYFFITTPDDCIEQVAYQVLQHHHQTTLVHCSGSLPSHILNPTQRRDIQTLAMHPLHSITTSNASADAFYGIYCSLEGDSQAVATIKDFTHAVGANTFEIDAKNKPRYHAALCIASNYLVTLTHIAQVELALAGLNETDSKSAVNSLMQSTLNNMQNTESLPEALTGPITRGDQQTIASHIQAIEPKHRDTYCTLGERTLDLTRLTLEQKQAIKNILS